VHQPTWGEYIRQNWLALFAVLAIVSVLISEGSEAVSEVHRWWIKQQPTADWIEYHSVEFVRELPDARAGLGALQMRSTTTVSEPVALMFEDTLRCSANGVDAYEFVSQNPITSSLPDPHPRRPSLWRFNADYPRDPDVSCTVRSVITATRSGVEKTIVIETEPFHPTGDTQ